VFNGGKGVGSQAGRVLNGVEFLVYAVRRDLALRLQLLVGLYPTRAQLAGSVHVNSVGASECLEEIKVLTVVLLLQLLELLRFLRSTQKLDKITLLFLFFFFDLLSFPSCEREDLSSNLWKHI